MPYNKSILQSSVFTILFFLLLGSAWSQDPLSGFNSLIGGSWHAEGEWGNGPSFKQITEFSFELSENIVIARSQGYTDKDQTMFGPRNFGIRRFDAETGKIQFTEYDVFGGATKGEVWFEGQDIYYLYDYGGTVLTDLWGYVDDNTYNYTVGIRKEGEWVQKLLTCQFKRM